MGRGGKFIVFKWETVTAVAHWNLCREVTAIVFPQIFSCLFYHGSLLHLHPLFVNVVSVYVAIYPDEAFRLVALTQWK